MNHDIGSNTLKSAHKMTNHKAVASKYGRLELSSSKKAQATPRRPPELAPATKCPCLCCTCVECCTCTTGNTSSKSKGNSKSSNKPASGRAMEGKSRMATQRAANQAKPVASSAPSDESSSSSLLAATGEANKRAARSAGREMHRDPSEKTQSRHLEKVAHLQQDQYDDCAKCLLIARFTSTQARLTAQRQSNGRPKGSQSGQSKAPKERRANSEVSSLTASSLGGNHENDSASNYSNWSLSSCSEPNDEAHHKADDIAGGQLKRFTSERSPLEHARLTGNGNRRRRAPLPPNKSLADQNNNANNYKRQSGGCDITRMRQPRGAKASSVDSGNTSETSRYLCDDTELLGQKDKAEVPPTEQRVNLLNEAEIYSIEHSLRSLKSSTYVCGCLANLYLTNTCLADNGRQSRPTSWQLSQTGVPVLTFDSGLTRNRDKRRLCISLAERGSGFILWSDVIDHLSDYRAYSSQLELETDKKREQTSSCDTFHVMYLSSNHRLMVGLSFDDARCARLFLRQVELIISDPVNIALSGPKRQLAKRTLASMGRLSQLLVKGRHSSGASSWRATKGQLARRDHEETLVAGASEAANTSGLTGPARNSTHLTTDHRSLSTLRPAAPNDGWSTLKRVMRFGQRRAGLAASSLSSSPQTHQLRQVIDSTTPWLRPRPLASLATAGRNFRRLPRKCDISAPCLFEHVTRVDAPNFEKYYTRPLIAAPGAAPVAKAEHESAKTKSQSLNNLDIGGDERSSRNGEANRMISRTEPTDECQQTAARSCKANDRSTSSSCYSSASISPASSDECGDLRAATPSAVRTSPPVPPARRAQTPATSMEENVSESDEIKKRTSFSQKLSTPGTKVKAIIRELQSQTSTDLVDAKRLLMADIAAQAAARLSKSVSRL